MSLRLSALLVVILLFSALTVTALMDVGYFGILEPHFKSWGAGQVLADLTILGGLACLWMIADARQRGLSAWPFVVLTLFLGSFGPLFYLVLREVRSGVRDRATAGSVPTPAHS